MFWKTKLNTQLRPRRRRPCGEPRYLSPNLMRDIGLEPWPEEPVIVRGSVWLGQMAAVPTLQISERK